MDCFYAAVHMRDDPDLRGKPVVIGGSPEGRGVVAAASYEARAFGIQSAQPAARAVRLCPHAVFLRPDFRRYRAESRAVFAILRRFTPVVQPVSIDEAFLDVSDRLSPWGSATALAAEIRRQVREERSLTVSIGVGPNKLIAKIASALGKPDGLTVVPPRRVQAFLDPLPVRRLPGVGPATDRRMRRAGIETIADLRAVPMERLTALFGRLAASLYERARGLDERPVRGQRVRKSLGHERTFAADLDRLQAMDRQLELLGRRVAEDLRRHKLAACTVTLKVRFADFTTLSRSLTRATPTRDAGTIVGCSQHLLRRTPAGQRSVRLLGISASNLVAVSIEQLELFDERRLDEGPTASDVEPWR